MAGLDLSGKVGKRTSKGTLITQELADAVRADNLELIIVEENTKQVLKEMDTAIARALEAIGLKAEGDVVGYMTEHYIVDTGRLRNSITHTVDSEKNVYVGTNVDYAQYVHEGVYGKDGRPFLTEPIIDNATSYRMLLETILKK